MLASIAGTDYRVEFRYRRPDPAAQPRHKRFNGSAACVIICDALPRKFIAIGQSVCSSTERFSRREGRNQAFRDAVESCGLLKGTDALPFFDWFSHRFPAPVALAKRVAARLSEVEIAWRKEQGRARKAAERSRKAYGR